MLGACRRGFDLIDQHLLTLGATELRARATMQGAEFAVLAQRHAVRAGRPRQLLQGSERWRATALAAPPVLPADAAREIDYARFGLSRLAHSRPPGRRLPRRRPPGGAPGQPVGQAPGQPP